MWLKRSKNYRCGLAWIRAFKKVCLYLSCLLIRKLVHLCVNNLSLIELSKLVLLFLVVLWGKTNKVLQNGRLTLHRLPFLCFPFRY